MKTEQLNSETQILDEKVQKIREQIYPTIVDLLKSDGLVGENMVEILVENLLDRLKNSEWLHTTQRGRASKSTPERKFSMFLPELDYYIACNLRMGNFRECGYKNTGEIHIPAHPTHADKQKIALSSALGAIGFTVKGVALGEGSARPKQRFDVLIPSSTLKIDVSDAYRCRFDSDFRVVPQARTHYMPGVADKKLNAIRADRVKKLIEEGMPGDEANKAANQEYPPNANNNRSARAIMWRHPEAETKEYWTNIFMPMIEATREYWNKYVPDDDTLKEGESNGRIVTKATMMALLDKFERGEERPGEIDWYVPTYDRLKGELVDTPVSEFPPAELPERPQKISLGPW